MNKVKTLYDNHAYDSPAEVDAWIDRHSADTAKVRAFGPIAMMTGQFEPTNRSHIYQYQFVPDANGLHRAVVMPVYERGVMVDIVAFRYSVNKKRLDVWGMVTSEGQFLNHAAIYDKTRTKPLVVCENWWQWLRIGCMRGVLPLYVKAIPELREAGNLVVGDSSHALQLLYEAYLWPLNADPDGPVWKAAHDEGRRRIWIDDVRAAA